MPHTSEAWWADSPQVGDAYFLLPAKYIDSYPTTGLYTRNAVGDYSINATGPAGQVIWTANFPMMLRGMTKQNVPGADWVSKGIRPTGVSLIYRVGVAPITAPSLAVYWATFWDGTGVYLYPNPPSTVPISIPLGVSLVNRTAYVPLNNNFFAVYQDQNFGAGANIPIYIVVEFTMTLAATTTFRMYGIVLHFDFNFN